MSSTPPMIYVPVSLYGCTLNAMSRQSFCIFSRAFCSEYSLEAVREMVCTAST
jgi:putative component of membrane protein insertase Oxa1/YidC/SpoIIIJ protein YidD